MSTTVHVAVWDYGGTLAPGRDFLPSPSRWLAAPDRAVAAAAFVACARIADDPGKEPIEEFRRYALASGWARGGWAPGSHVYLVSLPSYRLPPRDPAVQYGWVRRIPRRAVTADDDPSVWNCGGRVAGPCAYLKDPTADYSRDGLIRLDRVVEAGESFEHLFDLIEFAAI